MKVLVLGAGQLAQMMALAGTPLNLSFAAYDVGSDAVIHPITKTPSYDDLNSAIADCDVITAEFEHIPLNILEICERSGKLLPSAQAIKTGGDRRVEKAMLDSANVASASYHVVNTKSDYLEAIAKLGLPLVLKSALSGYDGKGQFRLKDECDIDVVWQEIEAFLKESAAEQAMVAEQFIAFDREVSLVGARDAQGQVSVYPITENIHTDGVLSVSLAFENESNVQQQAQQMFNAIAKELNYVGVLAIEFFQKDDKLLVNEIAPRVHNSGHWTQQGTVCSQFENHLRAVCGMPLGNTDLLHPTCMINILGEDSLNQQLLAIPGLAIHWYGKSKRPGRKMGHLNIIAETPAQLTEKLRQAAALLDKNAFPAIQELSQTL
jgi:5-(carboxyamino)imidazole ribonucleotide synthase